MRSREQGAPRSLDAQMRALLNAPRLPPTHARPPAEVRADATSTDLRNARQIDGNLTDLLTTGPTKSTTSDGLRKIARHVRG